ncbi:MAG: hypothetical protein Kow00124_14110 [Anaerolineae bacterium]
MAETTVNAPAPMNRREFLFYIWGASMALTLGGTAGVLLWYAFPRFREGEFGGQFAISPGTLPPQDAAPQDRPEGRFWLVNTAQGVLAIYKVCTHLGCLYKWVPVNGRFECPCHGSKFQLDGTYIEGPAPRSLDRFVVRAVDANGNVLAETPEDGGPLPLPEGAAELRVDTGSRIDGPPHG